MMSNLQTTTQLNPYYRLGFLKKIPGFVKDHRFEGYQAAYWIFYFLLSLVNNAFSTQFPIWAVLALVGMVAAVIYSILFIITKVQVRHSYERIGLLGIMFLGYSLIYQHLLFRKFPDWGVSLFKDSVEFTWLSYAFTMFIYYYHSMVESGLLAAIYRVQREEREKRKALEGLYHTKLQFLMAQLSPHFMYNFDNKVLAIATRTSPELVKPLEQRAEVLRYVTEHADKFTREVPLMEEVDYAQKLAAAYGFAHSGTQLYVRLHDDRPDHTIIPMLSSPLLENACEYGIYWEAENPITLDFYGAIGSLRIVCRNKINPVQSHNKSTGIGLSNLRKRLNLVYGDGATFEIVDDGVFYEVIINISYEEKTNR